jgi:hypothetical protein
MNEIRWAERFQNGKWLAWTYEEEGRVGLDSNTYCTETRMLVVQHEKGKQMISEILIVSVKDYNSTLR